MRQREALFDPVAFGARIVKRMAETGMTYRTLEDVVGVDHATVARVASGKAPSVENYLRLKEWLDQ